MKKRTGVAIIVVVAIALIFGSGITLYLKQGVVALILAIFATVLYLGRNPLIDFFRS